MLKNGKFEFSQIFLFLFSCTAFYIIFEIHNKLYHESNPYLELFMVVTISIFFIVSMLAFSLSLIRLEIGKCVPHLVIMGLCIFRVLFYEDFHSIEFSIKAIYYSNFDECRSNIDTDAKSTEFQICYIYLSYPWARYIIYDKSHEISRSYIDWPNELKKHILSDRTTAQIVQCEYRRVREIMDGFYYFESACE